MRYITLPNKRRVNLQTYINAWRVLRLVDPGALVAGFGDWPETAAYILGEIKYGIHDRINRHIPRFNVGRKWCGDWQRATLQCARKVNTPRVIVHIGEIPHHLRTRLKHRIYEE